MNDCLPNPCKNNGMCLDGDGTFTCKCAPGWTGNWKLFNQNLSNTQRTNVIYIYF